MDIRANTTWKIAPSSITKYLNKWPDFKRTGQPPDFMETSLCALLRKVAIEHSALVSITVLSPLQFCSVIAFQMALTFLEDSTVVHKADRWRDFLFLNMTPAAQLAGRNSVISSGHLLQGPRCRY